MLEKVDTTLYCLNCSEETEHKILYLDNEIKTIECQHCHKTSGIDKKELLKLYTLDSVEHILTEPFKLNEIIKKQGPKFLYSFSRRILSKPYRVMKDIFAILDD
jgi:hypothetical protein